MKSLQSIAAAMMLIVIVGCLNSAFGQSDRGSIRGTVTDPNGAGVPNARVVIIGAETGESRETTTNDQGVYVFPELTPATYNVTVEAQGFQQTTVQDFKVAVQVTHTLNIPVQIGVATNEVVINAESEALQSDTPVRQTNVTEQQVRELPLQVSAESGGRTPLAFIFLDSSVAATDTGTTSNGTNASRFRVNGGQALGTEILIDGASTRRTQNGTFFTEVAPGPNAYQEFTISTSSYSAEFGNSSGGVVNFRLKSGTNTLNGEVYDLVRNEKFNANSVRNKVTVTPQNPNGLPRDRDNQNNFGFNIGGPIAFPGFGEGTKPFYVLKNRAFFFVNYEGYRFTQGETVAVTVPTVRMRNGDFGELLTDPAILRFAGPQGIRIYNPRIPSNQRTTPLPGNIIPANLIDPAGARILQFFPLPNLPGVFRNYVASSTRPTTMNQLTAKTDFVINDKQRLSISYSRRDQEQIQNFGGGFPRFPQPFIAQDVGAQTFRSNFARVQHDYTITPTVINHLNIGYTFYDVINGNAAEGFDTSSLGIPANATQNAAFPRIGFPGYGDPVSSLDPRAYQNIGSTFFTDRIRDGSLDIADFVTFVTGRQTIKVGGNVRVAQFNFFQRIDPGGSFNFRNEQTASDIDPNGGFPIASLITGATEFAFNFNNSIDPAFGQITQSYFVQDDIRLTQKLTLNVGLRYDLPGLRTERNDRFRTFNPDVINPLINRPGAIVSPSAQGALQTEFRTLTRNDKSNIGPRLGLAYAFDDKTVVRAGAGLYYAPVLFGANGSNELNTGLNGYNTNSSFTPSGPGNRNAQFFLSTFPSIPSADPNAQFIGNYGTDIQFFDPNFRTGRTFQYSADVQRELPYKFVASIGYVGHKADRLRSNFNRVNALPLNALRLGNAILRTPLSDVTAQQRAYASSVGINIPTNNAAVYQGFTGTVSQALRPFPQYGNIVNLLESQGQSTYNSLQAKLERRFSSGIQGGVSYTFSRLVTDASEDLFGGGQQSGILQNPFDRSSLRTVSPNNPPHIFVANFLAELPFGKGKRFIDKGGLVNTLLGGFQVSGILRYQSGLPVVFFTPENTAFLTRDVTGYLGNLRPNLTGQPIELATPQDVFLGRRIINSAAFSLPANFEGAPSFLLANGQINPGYGQFYSNPLAFFGTAPAVITDFRTDPFFSEDISILKKTRFGERYTLEIGAEFFNVFNRVRYNAPNTDLRAGDNFGVETVADRPRVIQLRVRFIF